ncbi:hypothetical protein MMC30_002064 [Trapelia coarctata]|nr:hypothetical protein [Trapelia coarctata]
MLFSNWLFGQKASPQYQSVVQELHIWVSSDADRQRRFEEAVKAATSHDLPELSDLHSFADYLAFLDSLLTRIPSESLQATEIFNRIAKIYPATPSKSAPSSTPPPPSPQPPCKHSKTPPFNYTHYLEPRHGWRTFNEFFARQIKPGYRPISAIGDPSIITSPADCLYLGHLPISDEATVTVKGLTWQISELLADSPFKERFKCGTFIHGFLGVNDYHRWHAPVAGTVLEARTIQGQMYMQIGVRETPSPNTQPLEQSQQQVPQKPRRRLHKRREFHAPNDLGYQFVQSRGLVVLDTPMGLAAVLPVGMATVCSVVVTVEVAVTLAKGEEMGYFQFGGSDMVVLFEGGTGVEMTADVGRHYRMGMEIGRVR